MGFDFGPALETCDETFGEPVRYTPPVGDSQEFQAVVSSPDEVAPLAARGGFQARAWTAEVSSGALAAPARGAILLRLDPRAGEPDRFEVRNAKASRSGGLWLLDLKESPAP